MHSVRPDRVYHRRDLCVDGATGRHLTALVRAGALLRPRQGWYLHPQTSPACIVAAGLGGWLGCTSALAERGVFVRNREHIHVHVPAHATRLQPPRGVRVHWAPLQHEPAPGELRVRLFDALACAIVCQPPRDAIATLDSALHLRLVDEDDVERLLRAAPRRRALRSLVDGRAESGPETYVRLLLRSLGLRFECQVRIPGVGRVDFLVEGWLVIECDSRAYHGGWDAQVADRQRDLALAERGFACVRPIAAEIFADAPAVGRAITGILASLSPRTFPVVRR